MSSQRYVCGRAVDAAQVPTLSQDDILAQHERHSIPEKLKSYYCTETRRHWDLFYRDNTDRFFKDRHYLLHEFPELDAIRTITDRRPLLLECGCGVGNALFPLLATLPNLDAVAVDFSDRSINMLRNHAEFDPERITAFVHDMTQPFPETVRNVDICTMLFALSAIVPISLRRVVDNIRNVLRGGGIVVIRDYAHKDMTQLRFDCKSRLDTDLYIRGDGTLSYFFKKEELEQLFMDQGFEVVSSTIVEKVVVNRKENLEMQRRWLQCVFKKSL